MQMQSMKNQSSLFLAGALALAGLTHAPEAVGAEPGFTSLFDGRTLSGWKLVGGKAEGYVVKDGVIVCPATGGGNLFTEKEYANFVFRFEFKLTENANNGVGIRAPLEGDAAYLGMEIQVLDDNGPQYKDKIQPWQYHGSIYDVVAARRASLKPTGQWNEEEIMADGRRVKVTVNGEVIVDANLNDVTNPETIHKHPGLFRERGHIGFLGHGTHVEFRNIRIQELPASERDNTPPPGFTALFNGKDLTGWKGLLKSPNDNPIKRAQLTPDKLNEEQAKADERMRAHWMVKDGALHFDGKGDSLCTVKDYADFELLVDWKIPPNADSGIYLRGIPQVQIWDPTNEKDFKHGADKGSGGLWNNTALKQGKDPLKRADKPVGEWNQFRILMVGEKVHVLLNNEIVVNNATLENYWDRTQPAFPTGQIELQNHGNNLYFKNIYIREIPKK